MPLAARLWLKQVSEARKLVSANGQVRGCPAGKFHRKQYPVKVIPSGKIGQLSCLVSTFSAEQQAGSSGCLHQRQQRLAAWTSFPLTEVEPDQSASLCFQCNHLQSLTWDLAQPVQKKLREFAANS